MAGNRIERQLSMATRRELINAIADRYATSPAAQPRPPKVLSAGLSGGSSESRRPACRQAGESSGICRAGSTSCSCSPSTLTGSHAFERCGRRAVGCAVLLPHDHDSAKAAQRQIDVVTRSTLRNGTFWASAAKPTDAVLTGNSRPSVRPAASIHLQNAFRDPGVSQRPWIQQLTTGDYI